MYSLRMPALSALRIALLVGLSALAFFVATNSAHAANTVSSAVYQDTNGDGTVDRVVWTMDENVTACAYDATDWTIPTPGTINITAVTGISCTGSDHILNIAVTASANITGGSTNPTITYTNGGLTPNSITLTSGNMTTKAAQAATDAAQPVVVSTYPGTSSAGIPLSADIVFTFSEPMDTTFAENTEFTVTPDPGSFSAAGSVGNTVITLTTPTLLCGHSYTVATAEAAIDASAGSPTGLLTTGPKTGDFTFRTSDCSSPSTLTPVAVSSLTYGGADCNVENQHSFLVTGTNIDEYLVSGDPTFGTAQWQSQDIEGSGTIVTTFNSTDTTGYVVLKSDDGVIGATYSFPLTSWESACGSSDTSDDNSDVPPPTDTSDDSGSGSVTPVAGVTPGDVIHSSTSTAVYYVTPDYGRRVFINEATYFTWFDSFSIVKEVSADTLAALPLEGNMLPKSGVVLVKIVSSPDVYFLDDSSEAFVPELRLIGDENTAISLFGSDWADFVIDIEPTFFTKFASGTEVNASEDLGINLDDMKAREDLHE